MSEFCETDVHEAIARGWCQPNTQNIEMDAALADAIAAQVLPICRDVHQRVEELEGNYYELSREVTLYETAIDDALNELGMPTLDTPAPVANAWAALYAVLNGNGLREK